LRSTNCTFAPRRYGDNAAVGHRLDAVLQRVLDQRDQHAGRYGRVIETRRDVDPIGEPLAEPRLHDRQIRADHRCLIPERRRVFPQRRRRRAQETDQVGDQPRGIRCTLFGELLGAPECVEQKVRLNLQLQHPQLRFRKSP